MFGEREIERARERERERRLFKWCRNIPSRHCYVWCMLFKRCTNLPARHCVAGLQAVSAVSEPTSLTLCCWAAGCFSGV